MIRRHFVIQFRIISYCVYVCVCVSMCLVTRFEQEKLEKILPKTYKNSCGDSPRACNTPIDLQILRAGHYTEQEQMREMKITKAMLKNSFFLFWFFKTLEIENFNLDKRVNSTCTIFRSFARSLSISQKYVRLSVPSDGRKSESCSVRVKSFKIKMSIYFLQIVIYSSDS